jgi:hypothetical protein
MSEFEISSEWLPQKGKTEADVTMSRLLIKLGDRVVTQFMDDHKNVSRHLEVPAYYVAEWIAENWWPLLSEPRKSEDDSDNAEFLSRHSLLSAQHGFALPKILLVPLGRSSIQISASPRDVQYADVRFQNGGLALCNPEEVEFELKKFVSGVVARLDEANIADTFLQNAWDLISETQPDEVQFCRFAGALGLSPYDVPDTIAALIERLLPLLGEHLLMDLCLVSPAQTFPTVAELAERAFELTKGASLSTLSPLEAIPVPKDNMNLPAYRRGIRAAEVVRQRLGIKDTDPRGATRVFEALQIDTTYRGYNLKTDDEISITGAVVREDTDMKVALLQSTEIKRRFAGARAIFSALSADQPNEGRLLTSAVTRDQQANRAFAAELTAPRSLLRSKAHKGRLTQSAVFDLADDLQIGADVVSKQALNNGIQVSPI